MKTLALFDFDGTLYKKDSLIEFTKFSKGNLSFYKGMFVLFPYLLGLKTGLLSNEKVKMKYIQYFFGNIDYNQFCKKCSAFSLQKIDEDLDRKILSSFQIHLNDHHSVYIVTASFSEWIQPWASAYNVEVIGTKIESIENKVTGRFSSRNCFGIEKVNRIKEIIDLDDYDEIYVYGSGKGDFEMLQLARKNK